MIITVLCPFLRQGFFLVQIFSMIEGAQIWLNGRQRAAVALVSAVGALVDPRRADLMAALGETTGKQAFERVLSRMKSSPEGSTLGEAKSNISRGKPCMGITFQHIWCCLCKV